MTYVDNTSDSQKPISTATQLALNEKANKTNPSFTENLAVENTATTGASNIYFKTNNSTRTARIYMNETGMIKLDNNSVNALQVFPTGVLGTGRKAVNKLFSLYA